MADRGLYVGLKEDLETGEGITPIAKIVLDGQLFGLIANDETCKGWPAGDIQSLYEKVILAWDPYGSLPSLLPPELAEKHNQLYTPAIANAKERGWDPMHDLKNER